MISCSDAVRRLWDYLDGAIEEEERHAIEEHLDVCRRCCGEAEFATELKNFLATQSYADLPADVQTRLTSFLEDI
jgi:anti-sigma factor (TIGR02949 family)